MKKHQTRLCWAVGQFLFCLSRRNCFFDLFREVSDLFAIWDFWFFELLKLFVCILGLKPSTLCSFGVGKSVFCRIFSDFTSDWKSLVNKFFCNSFGVQSSTYQKTKTIEKTACEGTVICSSISKISPATQLERNPNSISLTFIFPNRIVTKNIVSLWLLICFNNNRPVICAPSTHHIIHFTILWVYYSWCLNIDVLEPIYSLEK